MKIIGRIRTDFREKFGIPRQSLVVEELVGKIVFEPEYRNMDAFRGLEDFNYIWILWEFSENKTEGFRATVRPPRFALNENIGVFATRSPYRPNPIGMSSVKLVKIEETEEGPILVVSGVDMLDNTPIYDIKPYIPFADCHPDATEGFTAYTKKHELSVIIREEIENRIPAEKKKAILKLLAQDPRPSYQSKDKNRVYGLWFAECHIKFTVKEGILEVISIET